MKMILIYIIILIVFINSKDFQILDLQPYTSTYYAKDMIQRKEDILIYKFEPKTENKNIFLFFLGDSDERSFEFYLYKNLSAIKSDDYKHFTNYLEKLINYREIKINHNFDVYYILVKMNLYEDMYDYLSLMIYNSEEYWNIGNFETNQEYILALQKSKEIILTYPSKNITQRLYLRPKGACDGITYTIYKNNSEPEFVSKINLNCQTFMEKTITFEKNNNYYIHLSFTNNYKGFLRFIFYFLSNDKDIFEIKDFRTDIKFGYSSEYIGTTLDIDYRYYFINVTSLINNYIGYSIFEPFNTLKYRHFYKRYKHYDINELPYAYKITDFDADSRNYYSTFEEPFIFLVLFPDTKGLLLKIETYLYKDDDQARHSEMINYLYPKIILEEIIENHKYNQTELKEKNVFDFSYKKGNVIMKSNLDYFTILHPKRERIWSKTYLFKDSNLIFELQNSENASVEFQYAKETILSNLS